jgi:peptide/nickel transport system permease protein
MLKVVLRRLLAAVPLVLGVPTLTFVLVEAAPGRMVDVLLGDRPVPPEVRRHLEAAYGLDRPPLTRYLLWVEHAATLDFGWSVSRGRPVARVLADALPATVGLAALALALQVGFAVALGALHAMRPRGLLDRALGVAGLAIASIPTFWLGLMAILLLSAAVPVFPPSSSHSLGADLWPWPARAADALWHAALPALVLSAGASAVLARFLRAGLLRSLGEDFVRAARARGASPARVLVRHALRASIGPVLTLTGLSLPLLVSGSLVVEVVFGWPGMGRTTYEAILGQDLPVALAAVLLSTLLVIAGNLLADLALAWADPRVRADAGAPR